jgi:predicted metal-dependent enzyme (double-stranded beta helix superfamily)
MMSSSRPSTLAGRRDLDLHRQVAPELVELVSAVRAVVSGRIFVLDEERECLVEAETSTNGTGEVSGFAPPGDIHRVRNAGDDTAISIHIYGTDVSRIGSSVRRYYDHPVLAA